MVNKLEVDKSGADIGRVVDRVRTGEVAERYPGMTPTQALVQALRNQIAQNPNDARVMIGWLNSERRRVARREEDRIREDKERHNLWLNRVLDIVEIPTEKELAERWVLSATRRALVEEGWHSKEGRMYPKKGSDRYYKLVAETERNWKRFSQGGNYDAAVSTSTGKVTVSSKLENTGLTPTEQRLLSAVSGAYEVLLHSKLAKGITLTAVLAADAAVLDACQGIPTYVDEQPGTPTAAATVTREATPLPTAGLPTARATETSTRTLTETPIPPVCENKTVADLERNGIGGDLTVTPLSENGLRTIDGHEVLRPGLIRAVDNLALKFARDIVFDFTAVVVPEYAFDQVSKDVAAQNELLGTKMQVIRYDVNDPTIFNNPNVMWLVPFVGENGGGLAVDLDGNEAIMFRGVTGISERAGGKLKPNGIVYMFSHEEDANGQEVTNVRPIPFQEGMLEVVVGCYGTRFVKVDLGGGLVAVMVDFPAIYPVTANMADVWSAVDTVTPTSSRTLTPTKSKTPTPSETPVPPSKTPSETPTESKTPTESETPVSGEIVTGMPESVEAMQIYPDWNTPDEQGRVGVEKYQAFVVNKVLPAAEAMNIQPEEVVPMGWTSSAHRSSDDPYDFWNVTLNMNETQMIVGLVPDLPGVVMITLPTKFGTEGKPTWFSLLIPLDGAGQSLRSLIDSGSFTQPHKVSMDFWIDSNGDGLDLSRLAGREWVQGVMEQPVADITVVNTDGSTRTMDSRYNQISTFFNILRKSGSLPANIEMAMTRLRELIIGVRALR